MTTGQKVVLALLALSITAGLATGGKLILSAVNFLGIAILWLLALVGFLIERFEIFTFSTDAARSGGANIRRAI